MNKIQLLTDDEVINEETLQTLGLSLDLDRMLGNTLGYDSALECDLIPRSYLTYLLEVQLDRPFGHGYATNSVMIKLAMRTFVNLVEKKKEQHKPTIFWCVHRKDVSVMFKKDNVVSLSAKLFFESV